MGSSVARGELFSIRGQAWYVRSIVARRVQCISYGVGLSAGSSGTFVGRKYYTKNFSLAR